MKAALYSGVGKIEIVEKSMPKAGPGQAVVKIVLDGICGTDMELYYHGSPVVKPGIVLGHENVGIVHELGQGVTGLKVGDRVVAGPPGPCGECYFCRHGHPNLCVKGFPMTNGLGVDGGEAEYMLVRDPRNMLFRIPDNVPFEDAVLTDVLATAYRGIIVSRFQLGYNVVVSGAGPIGLAAVILLKMGGAAHITVLQKSKFRADLAKKLGADAVFNPDEPGLADNIKSLYGGIGADLTIEAAGNPKSFDTCLNLVRPLGQVLNLGTGNEPATINGGLMVLREVNLINSLAYGGDEVAKILHFLSSGKLNIKGLYSGSVPLQDIVEQGFKRLAADRSLIKVAVKP